MNQTQLQPGTLVTWTSQARGSTKVKEGKVLVFIPKWVPLTEVYPEVTNIPRAAIKSDNIRYFSVVDRYLVKVPRLKKTGEPSEKFDYYTPNAGGVKPINDKNQVSQMWKMAHS